MRFDLQRHTEQIEGALAGLDVDAFDLMNIDIMVVMQVDAAVDEVVGPSAARIRLTQDPFGEPEVSQTVYHQITIVIIAVILPEVALLALERMIARRDARLSQLGGDDAIAHGESRTETLRASTILGDLAGARRLMQAQAHGIHMFHEI